MEFAQTLKPYCAESSDATASHSFICSSNVPIVVFFVLCVPILHLHPPYERGAQRGKKEVGGNFGCCHCSKNSIKTSAWHGCPSWQKQAKSFPSSSRRLRRPITTCSISQPRYISTAISGAIRCLSENGPISVPTVYGFPHFVGRPTYTAFGGIFHPRLRCMRFIFFAFSVFVQAPKRGLRL